MFNRSTDVTAVGEYRVRHTACYYHFIEKEYFQSAIQLKLGEHLNSNKRR